MRLVRLDEPGLAALANGDAAAAAATIHIPVTAYVFGRAWRSTWLRRLQQVRDDPSVAGWVTGLAWDPVIATVVGRGGFHDRPDAHGLVEVGYAVDPAFRRRGYARAILRTLIARAAHEPAVSAIRASVAPNNVASTRLVRHEGFQLVDEQWDEEDGLELVYERPAHGPDALPGRSAQP